MAQECINRLKQETGIRSGATVSGNIADVNVNATSVTTSDALLLGVSVGAGAASGVRSSVTGAEAYWVWAGSMAVSTKVRERVPDGTMKSFFS